MTRNPPEEISIDKIANFTPKQLEAVEAVRNHKFVLYGGAMGGGKSYWLRWMLVKLLDAWSRKGIKHAIVGLFCEDYPALKDRHLLRLPYEFPAEIGHLNISDHNFILNRGLGGGIIAFRNLDDASKYQSSEFAAIAVDELTRNKRETFDFLRSRLRWKGIDKTKFLGATNPGNIGAEWVKRFWIEKRYEDNETEREEFIYIPAKASDNPYISSAYVESLKSQPESLRRAFLDGDWNVFQGQFFTEWRPVIHICGEKPLLAHYRKFICADYGYSKPSAAYWCYLDENGVLNVYRELYKSGLTYEQLAKEISSLTPAGEIIDSMVFDPSIWAKQGANSEGLSGAEIFAATWEQIRHHAAIMIKGRNERIMGWNMLREYMKPIFMDGTTTSKFQVWNSCPELIRTIPTLIYSGNDKEDLDTNGEDHALDAIRYGVMSRQQRSPGLSWGVSAHLERMLGGVQNQDPYPKPDRMRWE